jgi:transposase
MGASLQPAWSPILDLCPHWRTAPLFSTERRQRLIDAAEHTTPHEHGWPGKCWTLKKFRQWIADTFGDTACRSTIWRVLDRAGLSWKKVKKLLGKACPVKREQFLKDFHVLYEQVCFERVLLLYLRR